MSSTPATRLDVINVQEHLDRKLQERQARETGICPVREELYAQCFGEPSLPARSLGLAAACAARYALPGDGAACNLSSRFSQVRSSCSPLLADELIRQVTVNCAERGLLLLRVRDEMRMTIAAYQTLYESSVAFGMRKALQAEQGKSDMQLKIKTLESDKRDLERQVAELKAKCDTIEKKEAERRAIDEKKHLEEVSPATCISVGAYSPIPADHDTWSRLCFPRTVH